MLMMSEMISILVAVDLSMIFSIFFLSRFWFLASIFKKSLKPDFFPHRNFRFLIYIFCLYFFCDSRKKNYLFSPTFLKPELKIEIERYWFNPFGIFSPLLLLLFLMSDNLSISFETIQLLFLLEKKNFIKYLTKEMRKKSNPFITCSSRWP